MCNISYDVAERKINRLTSGKFVQPGPAAVAGRDLARASMVGVATVRRAELRDLDTGLTAPNDAALRRAFEAAGIEFSEDEGAPGVRLRSPKPPGR